MTFKKEAFLMKKLSIMILLLISITLTFVGCGKNEEKLCKDVVKAFAVEMYNESCDELEKLYAPPTGKDGQENYESNIKASFDVFKEYFTHEGFENFINDKTLLTYHDYLIEKKMNMAFFDISYNDIITSKDSIKYEIHSILQPYEYKEFE